LNKAKCNDSRKLLMERNDIADARAIFLRTMNEVRQAGATDVTV
jgi:hypothetical protein